MQMFFDVVGHRRILDVLADDVRQPSHAYLFVGPGGVGKATVARRFAAALLCSEAGQHPVACSSCRRALDGVHPDLLVVEPDGRTSLSVDRARRAVGHASLAPVESSRKVFLFEEAEAMTDQAANSMLKTLEEPTATTIFLLVAETEDDLPATVASRSRTVYFGRVDDEHVAQALINRGVEADQAHEVARIAGGRPGLALALAIRPEVAAFRRAWLSVPGRLTASPGESYRLTDDVLAAVEPLLTAIRERHEQEAATMSEAAPGADHRALRERHIRELRRATRALYSSGLEMLASWYRDAAAAAYGAPTRNRDIPATDLAQVGPVAAVASADRVFEAIEALEANQRPPLVLASLFADLGAAA